LENSKRQKIQTEILHCFTNLWLDLKEKLSSVENLTVWHLQAIFLSPHLLDLLPHLVHEDIAMFQSVLTFVLEFGEQHS
jgi:hypothetical protein